MEKLLETHPKAALAASAALWGGMAVLCGLRAREAWREDERKGAIKAGAGAVVSGAVAGLAVAREAELLENPFRFE